MKESRYNIFIEEPEKVLCYNSYTDSYIIVTLTKNIYTFILFLFSIEQVIETDLSKNL